MPDVLSLSEARRVALAAQGFDRSRPRGEIQAKHIERVIRQLGVVQIDYVNVLVPAHYVVFFSRLGPYRRSLLDAVIYPARAKSHEPGAGTRRGASEQKRQEPDAGQPSQFAAFTEQWAHEASILPVDTWPLLRHRMAVHRPRPYGFERFLERHQDYVQRVLEEVRAHGPLTADKLLDLEMAPGVDRTEFGRIPGAWVGTVQRAVLEAQFGRGLLAVAARQPNFARAYDLAECVVPPEHLRRNLSPEDADRELVRRAARACGVGTAADLADYYRMPVRAARQRIAELAEQGELREVSVEGWREPAYLHREASLRDRKNVAGVAALLSPFDPLVWHRPRAARLFNFDYSIEIFVPREKRRWGYYVLPFLVGDRLMARVDLKAERVRTGQSGGRLVVLAAYVEPVRERGRKQAATAESESCLDAALIAEALARELGTMAKWLGLGSIMVEPRGNFARLVRAALRA